MQTQESSISKSTGKSETIETSVAKQDASNVHVFQANGEFVAKYWSVLVGYFGEMIQAEENVEPTLARTNELLHGFISGTLHLWVATSMNSIVGFFVTSKYVGGPAGSGLMYLSYLRGLDTVPKSTWASTVTALKDHMAAEGCSVLIATTKNERVRDLAQKLGAQVDYRLTWRA